jgi:hypothetical protein
MRELDLLLLEDLLMRSKQPSPSRAPQSRRWRLPFALLAVAALFVVLRSNSGTMQSQTVPAAQSANADRHHDARSSLSDTGGE